MFCQKTMEKKRTVSVESKLGDEIIFQGILPRLPVKSIFRFKSVCKKWCNLFTHDPLFRAHHHSHQTKVGPLMFCPESALFISSVDHDPGHEFKWSKPEFMSTPFARVSGSTNGLLYGSFSSFQKIFIVNPLTNNAIYVPDRKSHIGVALASDPCNPKFGYTIVAIAFEEDDDLEVIKFQLYSSKTRKWCASKVNKFRVPSTYRLSRGTQAVFIGGSKVYWSLVKHILWFDIEKDVAGLIECPHRHNLVVNARDPICYTEIGVCDGELSYSKKTQKGEIEIWLLRDKDKSNGGFEWVMKHTVSLQTTFQENWDVMSKFCHSNNMEIRDPMEAAKFFTQQRYSYPMPYSGGDHMWFIINNLECYSTLFLFNLRTQELKLVSEGVFMKYTFFPFMPTLHPCPR